MEAREREDGKKKKLSTSFFGPWRNAGAALLPFIVRPLNPKRQCPFLSLSSFFFLSLKIFFFLIRSSSGFLSRPFLLPLPTFPRLPTCFIPFTKFSPTTCNAPLARAKRSCRFRSPSLALFLSSFLENVSWKPEKRNTSRSRPQVRAAACVTLESLSSPFQPCTLPHHPQYPRHHLFLLRVFHFFHFIPAFIFSGEAHPRKRFSHENASKLTTL